MRNPFFIHGHRNWGDFCLNVVLFDRMWDWRVVRGRPWNMRGPNQGARIK